MQTETLRKRVLRLSQEILEVKKVQVVIGKNKKPIDKDDVIIFHIDF